MQTIRPAVWDRMKSLIQTDGRQPNYLVQALGDDGKWIDIPRDYISSIDIDNRLDYTASTCDIVLANENGRFSPDRIGANGVWETVFKDNFDFDSSNQYQKIENFHWDKETVTDYVHDAKMDDFNGFMTTGKQTNNTVSTLEFTVNIKNEGRLRFDFRKTAGSGGITPNDVLWYDDFTNGLRPDYQFTHDPKADDWAIRDYTKRGGKPMMSSGYSHALWAKSILRLPVSLPCKCILEYKHRIFEPNSGWAYKQHRLYCDGIRPPAPPHPVNLPFSSIDATNGGIEFGGNHSGKGSAYEHHQHVLEQGTHMLEWNTYFSDGKELARWEMDYIKIFAYENADLEDAGIVLELLINGDVVQRYTEKDVAEKFTTFANHWIGLGQGRQTITIRATTHSILRKYFCDIDNILVQNLIPGTDGAEGENYGLLLVPNRFIRVHLGYGESRDDLILRFTGMIDKVVDSAKGTITIKCRDMLKRLIETMIRPKTGEYSVAYPENPMDDTWWIASDIIADLINRAGCIAFVERTIITDDQGVEQPYVVPAIKFQEGRPIIDCVKEITDGINFRLWANRFGTICSSRFRYYDQLAPTDFDIDEYVDLTDLEYTLDDAEARGKLRVVCTYNNQAEEYMDEYLHYTVCRGEDRYASVETEWMETEDKRRIMAQYMFTQMKRKYKTISVGTVGNPFVDIMDYVKVLETVTQSENMGKKYTIVGIRTTVSSRGYVDVYDLEYGADASEAILVAYAWGDSAKNVERPGYKPPEIFPSTEISSPDQDKKNIMNITETPIDRFVENNPNATF